MGNRLYTVYIYVNKINKKRYIGMTKQLPKYRWANGKGYKNNDYFINAIQKYGWENFEHNIIAENLSFEKACELEKELIKEYKSNQREFGYNIEGGGNAKKEIPESTRNKMRGENNPNYNPHTDPKKRLQNKLYYERKKLGITRGNNVPHTEEHKKKISDSLKGRNMGSLNHNAVKVRCINTGKIFGSKAEAARYYNIKSSANISDVCNGRSRYAGKDNNGTPLIWEYVK